MKTYRVNEVFYSLQGEGVRAGDPSVFVRFTGCNLRCDVEPGPLSPGGFACDTEFTSGRSIELEELLAWIQRESKQCKWLVLTGGEPGLQIDQELCDYLHNFGYKLAVETNGTICFDQLRGLDVSYPGIDWITLSPKVAEHAIKQKTATEIKYVRYWGQGIPKTEVKAQHYVISPAFSGNLVEKQTLEHCIKLCKDNPPWRLSVQMHKLWQVR